MTGLNKVTDFGLNSAQLASKANQSDLGDLTQLNTTDKSSVVNALKEIKSQANTNATNISGINAGPKGTYASLSALQTAFPTGNNNIYVVTADGKWYYWNGSAWTAGGTYLSSVNVPSSTDLNNVIIGNSRIDDTTSNYVNKVSGDTTANGNIAYRTGGVAPIRPDQFSTEFDNTRYGNVNTQDGVTTSQGTAVNTNMGMYLFSFNVIRILNDKYGANIWQGATTLAGQIAIAQQLISKLTFNWYGYGTAPSGNGGNGATIGSYNYTSTTWDITQNNTAGSVQELSLVVPTANISTRINPTTGFIHLIAYSTNPSDGTTPSTIYTDYVECVVEIPLSTDNRYYNKTLTDGKFANVASLLDYSNNIVVSGLLPTMVSSLNTTISSGTAYVNGMKVTKGQVSQTFPANSDTYIDMDQNGNYTFTSVTNGASYPSIPSKNLRVACVVTNATAITAVHPYNTNFAMGYQALSQNGTQQYNTAIGYQSLMSNAPDGVAYDNGLYNTSVGALALKYNTTGNHNCAFGFEALEWNTTGLQNNGIGEASLFQNTTGSNNVAVGTHALLNNTTGGTNTVVGNNAMTDNTNGGNNVAVGYAAGANYTSGSTSVNGDNYLTLLGYETGLDKSVNTGTFNNSIAIGANALVNDSNTVQLGSSNVQKGYLGSNRINVGVSGATANRPTANLYVGMPFYDTTLGKPVWCHQVTPSVVWHDATGTTV